MASSTMMIYFMTWLCRQSYKLGWWKTTPRSATVTDTSSNQTTVEIFNISHCSVVVGRVITRSSAVAERPHDTSCHSMFR